MVKVSAAQLLEEILKKVGTPVNKTDGSYYEWSTPRGHVGVKVFETGAFGDVCVNLHIYEISTKDTHQEFDDHPAQYQLAEAGDSVAPNRMGLSYERLVEELVLAIRGSIA